MIKETEGTLRRKGVFEDMIVLKAELGDEVAGEVIMTRLRIEHANEQGVALPTEININYIRLSTEVLQSCIGKVGFDYPPSK